MFALDTTALITFGKNGEFRLIEDVLGGRAYITDEVYDECRSVRLLVDSALAVGSLLPFTITEPDDLAFFADARLRMDRGEASAITAARRLAGSTVTDDGDAIRIGGELIGQDRVIGVGDILCLAVAHGILTPVQAEVHLTTFITGGAFVPDSGPGYFDRCRP